jgi:hypothetical protein
MCFVRVAIRTLFGSSTGPNVHKFVILKTNHHTSQSMMMMMMVMMMMMITGSLPGGKEAAA